MEKRNTEVNGEPIYSLYMDNEVGLGFMNLLSEILG